MPVVGASLPLSLMTKFNKYKQKRSLNDSEAVRELLSLGLQYDEEKIFNELVQLKTLYYLRRIAGERGEDFINAIEGDFSEIEAEFYESTKDGFNYVK